MSGRETFGRAAGVVLAAALAQGSAAGAAPQRIVALQPALTETVCALGACERLVGVDRHSNWPQRVLALPQVGSMADANVEAIVALRPDLVLLNGRSRAGDRLRALGLRVLALDSRTWSDVQRNLELIAEVLGRPDDAAALWRGIELELAQLREQVPPRWRGRRVYMELHHNAAASEDSFIGEILKRLGLVNVVAAQLGPFPKLNPEYVVRADPDLIITTQLSTAPRPAERPGWHSIRAVREAHVCDLPSDRVNVIVRAGPRIGEVAAAVLDCLRRLPPP